MTSGDPAGCRECHGRRRRGLGRRELLLAAGSAAALATLAACGQSGDETNGFPVTPVPPTPDNRPLALVYRGHAACSGCAESVAALLQSNATSFRTAFVGPGEDLDITAETLSRAVIYAQPGGGTIDSGWRRMRGYADTIREFVRGGGNYLGFCLGGYLAGHTPGFGLLPGDANEYVGSPGATVASTHDTVIPVRWGGTARHLFFQDGPLFTLTAGAPATVLATYDNGAAAAVVATYGSGRVGVVGPHPEADGNWYRGSKLTNPDGIRFDLGRDLIQRTVDRPTTH